MHLAKSLHEAYRNEETEDDQHEHVSVVALKVAVPVVDGAHGAGWLQMESAQHSKQWWTGQ